jgi:hypothetical protein
MAMKASAKESRISFVRFAAALLSLWFGGANEPGDLHKPAGRKGKVAEPGRAPAIMLGVALCLLAAPFSSAQTTQITPTVMPFSSLQNVLLLDVNVGPSNNFDPHVDVRLSVWLPSRS